MKEDKHPRIPTLQERKHSIDDTPARYKKKGRGNKLCKVGKNKNRSHDFKIIKKYEASWFNGYWIDLECGFCGKKKFESVRS